MNKWLVVSRWLLLLVMAASLLLTIYTALQLRHVQQVNDYVLEPGNDKNRPDDPRAAFAHALWAEQKAQHNIALDEWTQVLAAEDKSLVAAAHYNRGNINLREALTMDATDARQIPLVELAKQDYRSALALNSDLWDVRYNLEIALRMVTEDPESNQNSEKNATSSRLSLESKAFKIDLP